MTDNQRRAIQGLAFGGQHEMAIRAAIAIGPDAVEFAVDRIMVADYVFWVTYYLKIDVELTDSFLSRPFAKIAMKTEQPRLRRYMKFKIKEWGLQSQVTL